MSENNNFKNNGLKNDNNLQGLNSKAIGNYTKGALENFTNKIVSETNYLEKVNENLDK